MNTRALVDKFWRLVEEGKSAALDINMRTGEMAVRCTKSIYGNEGNGAVPALYDDDWIRVIVSKKGVLIPYPHIHYQIEERK